MEQQYQTASQFSFVLKLGDDPTEYRFQEVSGLSVEIEIEQVVEGDDARHVYQIPKHSNHQNVTVKRGLADASSPLMTWSRDTLQNLANPIKPHAIIVSLQDDKGDEVAMWRVKQAWPVKWKLSVQTAAGAETAIESIEFAHGGIERAL